MGGDSAAAAADQATESKATGGVNINIRCSNGSKFSVQTSLDSTVGSFKEAVAQKCDIPSDQQRLIYKGRILKDDQTLLSYGLEADHTIHLVRGFAPAAPTNTTGGTNATTTNARGSGTNDGGSLGGSGFGASLFPGLGLNGTGGSGMNGLFGAGLPNLEQMQQPFISNPNLMREIMNTPAMQNLINNPEIVRNLIMSNPQMQELMDRNPELAHILNDPNTLRQTLEATRNPEIMREMMRNTDRAMSNIESSPEGFNMLRRMYENVQEPFLNATMMAGNNTGNDNSNPFAALSGIQGGQARNRSTNPSNTNSESAAGSPSPNTSPLPNPWTSTGSVAAGGTQNNTRSSSGGNARPQAPTGLGGLGLPDLEGMMGAMPDPALLTQLMQNPAISQMMQSILSNPQAMNQILGVNAEQRGMPDLNSHLRQMMQNPEFIRMFSSPDTMQQLLSFQQALLSQLGQQQSTQETGQTGRGTGTMNNLGLEMLSNMFGGLGAGSLAVPNRSDEPPEQLYATQLSQLQEMGFFDTQENIRALMATSGNVHAAVERLLGNSAMQKHNPSRESTTKTPSSSPPMEVEGSSGGGGSKGVGKQKRKASEPRDTPAGKPTCQVCGKEFGSWKSAFGHMRAHPKRHYRGFFEPPSFSSSSQPLHHQPHGSENRGEEEGGRSESGFDLNQTTNDEEERVVLSSSEAAAHNNIQDQQKFDLNQLPPHEDDDDKHKE
ncbi:ubiquitin domain-containing protein DSK2a-like isoform X1 [Senna tora]|uniref:Ubiquitin domain-containing protein DSK2a-like isoform X1 n=1 Tax=Senna tora TaxID=362788 RepID=A0A834STR7_9FABA|nr:ubiquitin domain-containing protein DSK2a-like isoform X1 [Senna tora]